MKKLLFIVISILLNSGLVYAQLIPKGISYQAVAINNQLQSVAGKNPENAYWANRAIQVRFTVYNKYPNGTAQMVENHKLETDKFGVFNAVIGQGENMSGDLFDVDWNLGQAHLQVEIDFENNGLYKLIGIERFWSVPYALNAANGNNSGGNHDALSKKLDSIVNDFNLKISEFKIQLDESRKMSLKDTSETNELQDLVKIKDSLFITDGRGIHLNDDDSTNELQNLKIQGNLISISSGNIISLNDNDSANEIQTISFMNDSLKLSKSNGISIDNLTAAVINKLMSNVSLPKFIYKPQKNIKGVFQSSSPYGWVMQGTETLDTILLDSGALLRLYIKSSSNGINENWTLADDSGVIEAFTMSHNSYISTSNDARTSGLSNSGMGPVSINGSEYSSTVNEVIFKSTKKTKLYLSFTKSWYVKSGTTNATWECSPWAYEIR